MPIIFLASTACFGQAPPNDNCIDAIPIQLGDIVSGSTTNATVAPQNAYCAVNGKSVWYSIVGTGNPIIASLFGTVTNYDSYLDLYSGSCTNLLPLVCSDDFCGSKSQLQWSSQLGVTYLLKVHGYVNFNLASGNYMLTITSGAVAQNSQTGVTYTSVQTAIDNAMPGTTINLLADVTENLLVTTNVVINANNKNLTIAPGNLSIKNGGSFKWSNGHLIISTSSKILNGVGGTLWNNGRIDYLNPISFINAGTYKGSGNFNGSFINSGLVTPSS